MEKETEQDILAKLNENAKQGHLITGIHLMRVAICNCGKIHDFYGPNIIWDVDEKSNEKVITLTPRDISKERSDDRDLIVELSLLFDLNYTTCHGICAKNQKKGDTCNAIKTIHRKSTGHYDDNLVGVVCSCGKKHPVEKKKVLWEEELSDLSKN